MKSPPINTGAEDGYLILLDENVKNNIVVFDDEGEEIDDLFQVNDDNQDGNVLEQSQQLTTSVVKMIKANQIEES